MTAGGAIALFWGLLFGLIVVACMIVDYHIEQRRAEHRRKSLGCD